jgi:hypothetical protein
MKLRVKVRHTPSVLKTAIWSGTVQRKWLCFWITAVNDQGYTGRGWHYSDPEIAAHNALASFENRLSMAVGRNTYHVKPTGATLVFEVPDREARD